MPSFDIKDYIIASMVIVMGMMYWLISGYKDEIKDLNYSLIVKQMNEKVLKSSVARQNKEINSLGEEYAERVREYYETKSKVTTRYIDRYITKDINTTRSSCEDINKIFDNIRHNGI